MTHLTKSIYMKSITKDWLEYAKADLLCCEKIIGEKLLSNIVIFHSHQSIEKSLKAILEDNNRKLPETQNLIRLNNLAKKIHDFAIDEILLQEINDVFIGTTYPGEFDFPFGKPTLEDAAIFLEFAKEIYDKIKSFLEGGDIA